MNPQLLRFKQRTHVVDNEEEKAVVSGNETNGARSANALHHGMFNFFFSNKRTIDKLRLRITQAI